MARREFKIIADPGPNKRLKEFRKTHLKMSQMDLGKELGISGSMIGYIESGYYEITADIVKLLKDKHELNPDWLFDGVMPVKKGEKRTTLVDIGDLRDRIQRQDIKIKSMDSDINYLKKIISDLVAQNSK